MNNLLNTIVLFGKEFDWTLESALFWLLIVQVVLIMFMVIVFAVLLKRVGRNRVTVDTQPEERALQGISLDLEMVKRNFEVGEEFTCDGLLINAIYNTEPVSELISQYAVITKDQLDVLQKDGPIEGCYIIVPDMSAEGKITVTVNYHEQQAAYVIAVGTQTQPEALPAAPTEYTAVAEVRKLVGLELGLDVVQRDFTAGDEFNCDGLIITAEYNFDPKKEIVTEFTVLDKEAFDNIPEEERKGCYVIKPSTTEAGKVAVTVQYLGETAVYMVVVGEHTEEESSEETTETATERKLVGITLDTSLVQREFKLNDEFNCDGLIVNAEYDAEPVAESLVEYSIVDELTFESLAADVEGCYVIQPDLTKSGKQSVAVHYEQLTTNYTIAVEEESVEEPVEEAAEPAVVTFPETLRGDWLVEGHEGVHVVIEEYTATVDGVEAANIALDEEGNYLLTANETSYVIAYNSSDETPVRTIDGGNFETANLIEYVEPVEEPVEEELVEEPVEEPVIVTFPETLRGDWLVEGHEGVHVVIEEYTATIDGIEATDIRVDSENAANFLMQANGVEYCVAYNTSDETPVRTIDGGNFETANLIEYVEPVEEPVEEELVEAPVEEPVEAPVEELVEEPVEEPAPIAVPKREVVTDDMFSGNVLRLDRSFEARIIQADDDQKLWYGELKNELLSYKKVHSRDSWKRESFNLGRSIVARIAFRGLTLCLYLPLNAEELADSKYKVEPIEDNASFEDTPCLYRIKNARRVKYAKELIAMVVDPLGAEQMDREPENYYVPYEDTDSLIERGLIRRNVRSKKDEQFFKENADSDSSDSDNK